MADIIKDSFAESNLHTKVIFQRGRDVTDWELNEAQDVVRVPGYRATKAGLQADTQNPGANDGSWEVVENTGDTSNKVFINGRSTIAPLRSGYLLVDGVSLFMDAGGEVVTGFTTYGGIGTREDKLWLRVEELEVADPAASAQLGETTRRKKLTYSWVIQEGGGAAPVGTDPITHPIWVSGGVQYFLMATITRTSGVAAIVNADIVDNRFLLAPYAVAQITRQSNFTVNAIVGNQFETSSGAGVVPISNNMTFVTDSTTGFATKWFSWTFPGYSGVATDPMYFYYTAGNPWIGLFLDDGLSFCSSTTLSFCDANTNNGGGALPLSSGNNTGEGTSRWGGLGVGVTVPVLEKLNARPFVTVGPGGDFDTIANAITYYNANVASEFRACHIVLRGSGSHTISTVVSIDRPLIIESEDAHAGKYTDDTRCVIRFNGASAVAPAVLNAKGGLTLNGVSCRNQAFGSIVVGDAADGTVVPGSFHAEDCVFYSDYTPTQSLRANGLGVAVGGEHFLNIEKVTNNVNGIACYVTRCLLYTNNTPAACGALVSLVPHSSGEDNRYTFEHCSFFGGTEGCIRIGTKGAMSKFHTITVNDCSFDVVNTTIDTGFIVSNTGIIYPDIVSAVYAHNSIYGNTIRVSNCRVKSTSANTATSNHLVLFWPLSGTDGTDVTEFGLVSAEFSNVTVKSQPTGGIAGYGSPVFIIASKSADGYITDLKIDSCYFDIYAIGTFSCEDISPTFNLLATTGKIALSNVRNTRISRSNLASSVGRCLHMMSVTSDISINDSDFTATEIPLYLRADDVHLSRVRATGGNSSIDIAAATRAVLESVEATGAGAAYWCADIIGDDVRVSNCRFVCEQKGLDVSNAGHLTVNISNNQFYTTDVGATDAINVSGGTLDYSITGNVSKGFPSWHIASTNANEGLHVGCATGNTIHDSAGSAGYLYVWYNTNVDISTGHHPGLQTTMPGTYTPAELTLLNYATLNP